MFLGQSPGREEHSEIIVRRRGLIICKGREENFGVFLHGSLRPGIVTPPAPVPKSVGPFGRSRAGTGHVQPGLELVWKASSRPGPSTPETAGDVKGTVSGQFLSQESRESRGGGCGPCSPQLRLITLEATKKSRRRQVEKEMR